MTPWPRYNRPEGHERKGITMNDTMNAKLATGGPTLLSLAAIELCDELGLALDNVTGVSYVLGELADARDCDSERMALNMLSETLRDNVARVQVAMHAMEQARTRDAGEEA